MYQRIFIRHLTTDKNTDRYNDSPLLQKEVQSRKNVRIQVNEEGHEEGKLLRDSFAVFLESRGVRGAVSLYHSDLERTRTTMGYILQSLDARPELFQPITVNGDDLIRDIDHGKANDMPYEEARERFPGYAIDIDTRGYLDARPPGGESHRDAMKRLIRFLRETESVRSHMVVITHMSTLVLFRAILESLPDDAVLGMLSGDHPPNSSVTRYEYDPETTLYRLAEFNVLPWAAEPERDPVHIEKRGG